MNWLYTSDLLDMGVDILTIALWTGHAPSECMTLRFPSYCVQPLINHLFEAKDIMR